MKTKQFILDTFLALGMANGLFVFLKYIFALHGRCPPAISQAVYQTSSVSKEGEQLLFRRDIWSSHEHAELYAIYEPTVIWTEEYSQYTAVYYFWYIVLGFILSGMFLKVLGGEKGKIFPEHIETKSLKHYCIPN